MTLASTDFKSTVSITNPSPLTTAMQGQLPSNYTQSQNSNVFAFMYGTGYALEELNQTITQLQANNYLYSPSSQTGEILVTGTGLYLIEFSVPFIVPPLNVSISAGSSSTDVYIEYTSNFGMTINVVSGNQDVLTWTASGATGAVNGEEFGDALYNNFGAIFNFPRTGDSIADATFVSQYESFSTFIDANSLTTYIDFSSYPDELIYNAPTVGALRGTLQPVSIVTNPTASHQLISDTGEIIALINFDVGIFPIGTTTAQVSSFYPANLLATYGIPTTMINGQVVNVLPPDGTDVYVNGTFSTFSFDRWDQLSYQQEVIRADNKYRRLLYGINSSLKAGPNVTGVAEMVQAIIAQPFIPQDIWEASDFRVFEPNPEGLNFVTYTSTDSVSAATQKDGYPAVAPYVYIEEIQQAWKPSNLTYNNKPYSTPIADIPPVQITQLNTVTPFDITNEVIRQLRVGLEDINEGGIIDWNYLNFTSSELPTSVYQTGVEINNVNYSYNYVFLNNTTDSVANLKIFYYRNLIDSTGATTGYNTNGTLVYNKDYYLISTSTLYDASANNGAGGYLLPAELCVNYAVNSALPALYTIGELVAGQNYIYDDSVFKPGIPSSVIQLALDNRNLTYSSIINGPTHFPTSVDDFIIYTYQDVNYTPGLTTGTFDTDPENPTLPCYYDSANIYAVQPSDSVFSGSYNVLRVAQGSYARFTSETGNKYVLSMVGGEVTFNKTVDISAMLSPNPIENVNLGPAGILILQVTSVGSLESNPTASNLTSGYVNVGNYFVVPGSIASNINNTNHQPYFQIDNASYLIMNENGFPCAIVASNSQFDVSQYVNGNKMLWQGVVTGIIWDTRIPVTDYYVNSPVFQSTNNFNAAGITYTPDLSGPSTALPINKNFLVLLQGDFLGNQQSVTASWTFNISQLQISSASLNTASFNGVESLTLSDSILSNSTIQPGIFTYFTGNQLIRTLGIEPDGATYQQQYESPSFGNSYFLSYKDYVNTSYGNGIYGNKLSTTGDATYFDTLYNNDTIPAEYSTILTFFNPVYGFIYFSIIPQMEFYVASDSSAIPIGRPRNLGIALTMQSGTYSGLVFYGTVGNQIVDKPTRLLVDFSYSASQNTNRHRIIDLDTNSNAGWVDGLNPNTVQTGDVFFIAGDTFKYSGDGYDQAPSFYSTNAISQPVQSSPYTQNSIPPAYEVAPGFPYPSTPNNPQRYRRPPTYVLGTGGLETLDPTYYMNTPEKISYFQFDLNSFPVDTILKQAQLELYFCSGFTINEAINKDLVLSYNSLWKRSRLSGNGRTEQTVQINSDGTTTVLVKPVNNVHWRKNYFEINIPYVYTGQRTNKDYGIQNIFTSTELLSSVQAEPNENLFYLGFVNLDEIGVYNSGVANQYTEQTEGLTNLVLTDSSVFYVVTGSLSATSEGDPNIELYDPISNPNGLATPAQVIEYNLPSNYQYRTPISQDNVLPNEKVLVFPFGDTNSNGNYDPTQPYVYGYVKSILPTSQIGFDSANLNLYKSMLEYIVPLYSQYTVNLLEADTYLPFMSFGRNTAIAGTPQDISY